MNGSLKDMIYLLIMIPTWRSQPITLKNNKKRVTQFLSPSLFSLKILFSAINILQTILLDWFEAHGWQSSFSDWLKK